jgi:hypothetical protein
MNSEKINEFMQKIIARLSEEHKFRLVNVINYDKNLFQINLISPNNEPCYIAILKGELDTLSEPAFIGALAHELAHYWVYDNSNEYKRFYKIITLKNIEEFLRKKGLFRKAEQSKNEYLSLLSTVGDLEEFKKGYNKIYQELENKTDIFAKEKLGFEKEIVEMRKVSEQYRLSFIFKQDN